MISSFSVKDLAKTHLRIILANKARGGRSDNPTIQCSLHNASALRVQKSKALDPVRGNCRRKRRLFDDKDQETIVAEASSLPLPKRSRNRSAEKLKKKKRKKDKHHDVCVLFSHQFLQCPF